MFLFFKWLFPWVLLSYQDVQSGDLQVTGQGKVSLKLNLATHDIIVEFKDYEHHVPCSPCQQDKLSWSIIPSKKHKFSNKYLLVITWEVTNHRIIHWEIK